MPQLRPRRKIIDYNVRSPTKPSTRGRSNTKVSDRKRRASIPSGALLRRIWVEMVKDGVGNIVPQYEIQTLSDGTVVRVSVGSVVFIQNDDSIRLFHAGEDNVLHLWIGTLLQIRENEFGTLGQVRWYYNFQDARHHLERPGGMSPKWMEAWTAGAGKHELFESDHIDIIDMTTVEDYAYVHTYVPTDQAQLWFTKDSWYTRGSITSAGYGTFSRRSPMKYSSNPTMTRQRTCCSKVYNPEEDRQILCKRCGIFYHVEELTPLMPDEPIDPLTRVVRGFGWEKDDQDPVGWSLVGNWGMALEEVDVFAGLTQEEQAEALDSLERVLGSIEGVYECKECLHHM